MNTANGLVKRNKVNMKKTMYSSLGNGIVFIQCTNHRITSIDWRINWDTLKT